MSVNARCGRRGRPAGRVERRRLGQHLALQLPQPGTGVDAQLVGEHRPGLPQGSQRVALAPRPVQGQHEQPPALLPQLGGSSSREPAPPSCRRTCPTSRKPGCARRSPRLSKPRVAARASGVSGRPQHRRYRAVDVLGRGGRVRHGDPRVPPPAAGRFEGPLVSVATGSSAALPRPSRRTDRSIVAWRSAPVTTRTRGPPGRPSRSTSQPASLSTWCRAAARPTVLAAWAPVTKPTVAVSGRPSSARSQRLAARSVAVAAAESTSFNAHWSYPVVITLRPSGIPQGRG
jgi:hypothetical protein